MSARVMTYATGIEREPSVWDGATVLVTGGTGSLGEAFTRYALAKLPVHAVRCFSRDEYKQAMLGQRIRDDRLRLLLGDVRDRERLTRAMAGVDIVIHAAALKRIDRLAHDPVEMVRTNVLGSINVMEAAIDCKVGRVLGVSTDKQTLAANTYGATKFLLERLFVQGNAYAGSGPTRFACTRWGNVLGSRGSVLEVWKGQAMRGESFTLTNLEMTRFWITLEQACETICHALHDMQGGEVFVPALPRARVLDLAEAYFGALPPRVLTGLRPGGEKLHEDLISPHETYDPWLHGGWIVRDGGERSGLSIRSCDTPLETVESLRELLEQAAVPWP